MAQYFDFAPNSVTAYTFAALLDGVQYNAVVTWNRFGLRWYLNLYTTQGAFVYSTPVVESPDGYDISLLPASFTAALVFRESTQQFEIWDAPNTYPSYSALPDYMLDSGLGKFVLDSSSLLGNDVMFDALGKPFILDQGQLPSEAMLDANGMQMVLGPSNNMNQGMLSATFSVAPLPGAIITATDANGVQYSMGSGDGSQTYFNTPQADTLAFPAQVYKQDWQGKQLQYLTARTNFWTYSDAPQNWSNNGNAIAVTPNAIAGPDGQMTAALLSQTSTVGASRQLMGTFNLVAGTTYTLSFWVKKVSGSNPQPLCGPSDLSYGPDNLITVSSTWQKYTLTWIPSVTGSHALGFLVDWDANGAPNDNVFAVVKGQLEVGSVATSNISTATAPVTVTDYAENIGGGILATTKDLSAKAMLDNTGASLTLDGSQI